MLKKRQGFTLLEVLIVVVIIGVLASLSVVTFNRVRSRARDTKRITDVRSLQSALELYYSQNDTYPELITPGRPIADANKTYLAKAPANPRPTDGPCRDREYKYVRESDRAYHICYCLSNPTGDLDSGLKAATSDYIGFNGLDFCAQWVPMGSSFFYSGASGLSRLGITTDNNNGTLYATHDNTVGTTASLFARKYNPSTNAWEIIGTIVDSLVPPSTFNNTSIAAYNNQPYVAYATTNSTYGGRVKYYDGSSWQETTTSTDTGGTLVTPLHYSLKLCATGDNSKLYFAYTRSGSLYVKYLSGGSWSTAIAKTGIKSASNFKISLACGQSNAYVAYVDSSNQVQVSRLDHSPSFAFTPIGSTIDMNAGQVGIFVENDTPYVAYISSDQNSGKAKKWDGTNWVTVGADYFISGITDNSVFGPKLAIVAGKTFVTFISGSTINQKIGVKAADGNAWKGVGQYPLIVGIATVPDMTIYNGTPYLIYRTENYKALVNELSY